MFKNYFILNRFITENKDTVAGSIVSEIFSQEKDKLVLGILKNGQEKFVEISVNPGFPYIIILDDFHRAKKNSIDFFSEHIPAEITGIEISGSDRIVRLVFPGFYIYFMVRGKYTNVVLLDKNDNAVFFKKYPDENIDSLIKEIHSNEFISMNNIPAIRVDKTEEFFEAVKKRYPFIGKDVLVELKVRGKTGNNETAAKLLIELIKELFAVNPVVCYDENTYRLSLSFESFSGCSEMQIKEFNSINPALNFYIGKKYYYDSASVLKKKIIRHIERETSKLSHKLNDIKALLDRGSKEEYYYKIGNLLLINIHNIKSGMKNIELDDIYESNNKLSVKLDEKLSPQKNVDRYFDKAKSDRILLEKSAVIFKDLAEKLSRLKNTGLNVEKEENIANLKKYMKELKMKDQENSGRNEDIRIKFKHYILENKYNVYVGKDSSNNDLLTVKFAKQNDYWFHARSVPGSHVVLRVENTKEPVPKNILKKAAALAAFHSKAKTSGTAPVSFTLKKYVVKKKGMEAGKVALLKEDVLLVKPEIPKDCEYISQD